MSLLSSCLWVIFFPHGPKQEKIRKKVTQPVMNMLVSKLRWKARRLCNFQTEKTSHWPVWDSQLSQKEISLCWLTLGYPAYTHTKWTHKHLPRRGAEQRLKLKRCLSLPHWPGVGHRHPYILCLPHCRTACWFPFLSTVLYAMVVGSVVNLNFYQNIGPLRCCRTNIYSMNMSVNQWTDE